MKHKWIYDGYTKVRDGKRMIEKWCYHCSACGCIVRTEPRPDAIRLYFACPNCGTDMKGENNE